VAFQQFRPQQPIPGYFWGNIITLSTLLGLVNQKVDMLFYAFKTWSTPITLPQTKSDNKSQSMLVFDNVVGEFYYYCL